LTYNLMYKARLQTLRLKLLRLTEVLQYLNKEMNIILMSFVQE